MKIFEYHAIEITPVYYVHFLHVINVKGILGFIEDYTYIYIYILLYFFASTTL